MGRPTYGYRNAADRKVPGVTTILKEVTAGMDTDILCSWSARLAREGKDWKTERNKAGGHGTALHELCEKRMPSILAEEDRRVCPDAVTDEAWVKLQSSYAAIRAWWLKNSPRVLIAEEALVSEAYQFGGTLDAMVELEGQPWLLDYKTGSMVGAKEVAQMAAYRRLLHEVKGIVVVGAVLIHAPTRDAGYVRPVRLSATALDLGWDLFEAALSAHRIVPLLAEACE